MRVPQPQQQAQKRACFPCTITDASRLINEVDKSPRAASAPRLVSRKFLQGPNPQAGLKECNTGQISQEERPPSGQAQGFQTDF